jgi:hypothetical protein
VSGRALQNPENLAGYCLAGNGLGHPKNKLFFLGEDPKKPQKMTMVMKP